MDSEVLRFYTIRDFLLYMILDKNMIRDFVVVSPVYVVSTGVASQKGTSLHVILKTLHWETVEQRLNVTKSRKKEKKQ